MARKQTTSQPLTTAQRLSFIVKSCRDIMRKDKGLNGDLDRLPMLTWIMFLKFLDDMEQIAEQEAPMANESLEQTLRVMTKDGSVKPESIQVLIDLVRENAKVTRPVTVNQVVDFSFLERAQKELGLR